MAGGIDVAARGLVVSGRKSRQDGDKLAAIEAAKPTAPDEQPFNHDVPVERQVYLWQDKYRPRKPRYFNRINTGFDWNKYNQTHYDHDNPPPKTVQGYKFNVRSGASGGRSCSCARVRGREPTSLQRPDCSWCGGAACLRACRSFTQT